MNFSEDTIAAVSTPIGTGGIGIIRLSGKEAWRIIERLFEPAGKNGKEPAKSRIMRYGHIVEPEKHKIIDEVLVCLFKEPYSFTKEDMAEINCHGGINAVRAVLKAVIAAGARLAEPGEFTKRAFINGRIDLSQAEAVIDLINSKTDSARKASINQLEGKLSKQIKEVRDLLIDTISDIEASIDYPEYDIEETSREKIKAVVEKAESKLERLAKTFFEGNIIREGISIAIIGKPNVGKSSLLNALAGKEKAIITDIPGTTRDIIEEFIDVGGIPVKFIDTAGLRETNDVIEMAGIQKTEKAISDADVVLFVLDGSQDFEQEDKEILAKLKDKKIIEVINKIDLMTEKHANRERLTEKVERIYISAKNGEGIDLIEQEIKRKFNLGEIDYNDEVVITNFRQQAIINETQKELEEVIRQASKKTPVDLLSVGIIEAVGKLGEITGETVREDVLATIFSKFCLGK